MKTVHSSKCFLSFTLSFLAVVAITTTRHCECFTITFRNQLRVLNNIKHHHRLTPSVISSSSSSSCMSPSFMSASIGGDVSSSSSTQSPPATNRITRISRQIERRSRRTNGQKNNSNSNVNGRQMKFIGTKQVVSKPIVISETTTASSTTTTTTNNTKSTIMIQLFNEFFSNDSNRNLLFPNSNNDNAESSVFNIKHIDDKLLTTWSNEAKLGGGQQPNTNNSSNSNGNENQSVFKIDALLQMPGLKIISESTIGMKLLLSNDNYPEYQFTLLDSKLIPNGSIPVVWLFNKLTKYRDSTSSFTRVRVLDDNDDNYGKSGGKFAFITDARLETRMHLPPKLLKVLPNVNIAKFESQGSDAVQRLLEKELEPALNTFCEAFCTFMKNKDIIVEQRRMEEKFLTEDVFALKP